MVRLRALQANPDTPGHILRECALGKTLGEIAREWKLPKGGFLAWIATMGDLHEQCRRAREIAGHELVGESVDIIMKADKENVTVAKEQASHLLKVAKSYHPKVYGDTRSVDVTVKSDIRGYSDAELQRILDERKPPIEAEAIIDGEETESA